MYAVVHSSKILDYEVGKERLATEIAPMVKTFPGFVRATWVRNPETDDGIAIVVFDSQEAAEKAAAGMRNHTHETHDDEHIDTLSVTVCEVAALV